MQIQPILGYFWAILGLYQSPGPPLLDLGPLFLHILDPALVHITWYDRQMFILDVDTAIFEQNTPM